MFCNGESLAALSLESRLSAQADGLALLGRLRNKMETIPRLLAEAD